MKVPISERLSKVLTRRMYAVYRNLNEGSFKLKIKTKILIIEDRALTGRDLLKPLS